MFAGACRSRPISKLSAEILAFIPRAPLCHLLLDLACAPAVIVCGFLRQIRCEGCLRKF
jgi:hypothetical protein